MGNRQPGTANAEAAANESDLQRTTATAAAATETTEVHEVPGNKVVNFVKNLLKEGNVNRIQISRQDGEVVLGLSLTAGVATTAAITLLLPALAGLSLIVLMVSHMRVEVVRQKETSTAPTQDVPAKEVMVK